MTTTVPFLDLKAQHRSIAAEIEVAVREVIDSQHFVLGPRVERFEAEFASMLGARHAIGVASGTDALLLALRALELDGGDEVISPAFTFFATAGAIWNAGLRPRFADVDPRTFNLTRESVEAALTPRTRAVVVVHLYGQMAPMAELMELARERDLYLIEDVAQALGARQQVGGQWRDAGTLGDAGAFSFFPTKILGGYGDGGLVTSEDGAIADRVRKLRVHGGHQMYHHEIVGTNSRLDALQAAVLSVKLPYVREWVEARRAVAASYDEALAAIPEVQTPVVARDNEHVFNVYTIRASDRDALRAHLGAREIGSNVYYPVPLHLQQCFDSLGGGRGDFPVSETLADEALSLPIWAEMTREHVDRVAGAIRDFYRG